MIFINTSIIILVPRKPITQSEAARAGRFGSLIATWRDAENISQEVLAQRAGVKVDWLRKLEQGRVAAPSFFLVLAILNALRRGTSDIPEVSL